MMIHTSAHRQRMLDEELKAERILEEEHEAQHLEEEREAQQEENRLEERRLGEQRLNEERSKLFLVEMRLVEQLRASAGAPGLCEINTTQS
jgi:hypothetical protein